MENPSPLTIVHLDLAASDPTEYLRIEADDPHDLVRRVLEAADSDLPILVAPDALVADTEAEWLGLTASLVVAGARAVETRHPKAARRLLTTHAAIDSAGGAS